MMAVILAAGKGTRLYPFTSVLPKPLMPVGLKHNGTFLTIIERIINQLHHAGIKKIIVVTHYKKELINEYLTEVYGNSIIFVEQKKLDGNSGAVFSAQRFIKSDSIIVVDADNFIIDYDGLMKLVKYHTKKKADITVGTHIVKNPSKYAIFSVDDSGRPKRIVEKPKNPPSHIAKSGVMILSNEIISLGKHISKNDEEYTTTQIIQYGIINNKKVTLYDLPFHDIGTWEEYVCVLKKELQD